jgi:hypothetical protein
MNPKDEYDYNITDININSFNNKADKGDDDFEDWLVTAPLIRIDASDQVSVRPCTSTYNKSFKYINVKSLKYTMPIDMLYKWYPEQMKELENDDEVPF